MSATYTAEIAHAATGELVESRAQSKKSFPVRAPSRSRSSVVSKSTPPSSSAHPVIEELDWGSSSTFQLAAKATSKKPSSTMK